MKRKFLFLSVVALFLGSAMFLTNCKDDEEDTTNPVITIKGDNPVTIDFGAVYTDAGATATDNEDGAITVTVDNPVKTDAAGEYTVNYTATDKAGNKTTLKRTVYVTHRNTNISGAYKTTENCTGAGVVDEYDCAITAAGANKMNLTFTNFGNFQTSMTLAGTLTGNTGQSITIAKQVVNGVTFEGTATVDAPGKNITITYNVEDNNGKDTCTATWKKQ